MIDQQFKSVRSLNLSYESVVHRKHSAEFQAIFAGSAKVILWPIFNAR